MVWQRIKNVEYPKIWLNFTNKNSKQKFIVKDLSPEYYDIALGYMTNMFLSESAICGPLKILEDPESRAQMQQNWLRIMRQNVAIICVTDDDETPRVAAIHLTLIRERSASEKKGPFPEKFNKFSKVVEDLKNEGELFDRFGVNHYLGSLGLFVLPEFRGLGIATQILKARIVMCEALGLRGTATVFSTAGAQAAARAAGYETIATKYFEGQLLAVMGVAVPGSLENTLTPGVL